jgi:isoaspartyl peptidase/L-asparaginase-like protein (Ntn-hydrolase superfamily)
MELRTEKSIDEIFEEGTLIDEALQRAVKEALLKHKQTGNPIVIWKDGKAVWLKPEEIPV